MNQTWLWGGFLAFILAMLALDLGVFNRKAHTVSAKEAGTWSAVWVTLAVLFGLGVGHFQGHHKALEFFAGYLVEEALSVDNLFVFILIFSYFRVPPKLQHRVLFWGILGALVMRGVMIAAGAILIERFHWVIYVFGAFLVFTGVRMATHDETDIEPEANPVIRLVRRLVPVTDQYRKHHFFVREPWGPTGTVRLVATPLFIVLALVETTDLVFAVDSIPAVFGVTRDPFIVYTSNVFAILGLRSLYFLLSGVIERFHYLKLGLAVVLVFVGGKMIATKWVDIHIAVSLGVIAAILGAAVVASLLYPKEATERCPVEPDHFRGGADGAGGGERDGAGDGAGGAGPVGAAGRRNGPASHARGTPQGSRAATPEDAAASESSEPAELS
jgi:tellurite resistance protein TerC